MAQEVKQNKFYIVFEGSDFCGKGTQIEMLRQMPLFNAAYFVREPTGIFRAILKQNEEESKDLLTPFGLEVAQNINKTPEFYFHSMISQRLSLFNSDQFKKNQLVISDRGHLSTYSYQCVAQKLDGIYESLWNEIYKELFINIHDLWIFIDISEDTFKERKSITTNRPPDEFDDSTLNFFHAIRKGYNRLESYIDMNGGRFIRVDGNRDPEQIHRDIMVAIRDFLPKEFY